MQEKKNYLLKVNEETNKIISFELVEGDMDDLMLKSQKANEEAPTGVRYMPMFKALKEPTVGADVNDELRVKMHHPSDESINKTNDVLKEALRLLMAIDMTIRSTGAAPLPNLTAKEAHEALFTSIMLLLALNEMHDRLEADKKEEKSAVDDLFGQLGLKLQGE